MKTISKKIVAAIMMVAAVIVLSGASAFSQCVKVGNNCQGNCPQLYYSTTGLPVTGGTYNCAKINGQCKCVLIIPGADCNTVISPHGNKVSCSGTCPTLQTAAGAPVQGTCKGGFGNPPGCNCVYIY